MSKNTTYSTVVSHLYSCARLSTGTLKNNVNYNSLTHAVYYIFLPKTYHKTPPDARQRVQKND